ncbi:MAG: phosphatase PAP2 family protein [Alphaproteobacteria bacterium]
MTVQTQSGPSAKLTFAKHYVSSELKMGMGLVLGAIFTWLLLAMYLERILPGIDAHRQWKPYTAYVLQNMTLLSVLLIGGFIAFTVRNRHRDFILGYMFQQIFLRRRIITLGIFSLMIGLIAFVCLQYAYLTIKVRIPVFTPFTWDKTFADMDAFIFFGRDPWTYFAFVYDYPAFMQIVDKIYSYWAGLLVSAWLLCFLPFKYPARERYQYCLALILAWFIGGIIIASLLSSAGPCYYGLVAGSTDIYAPQLALLDSIGNLQARDVQGMLWTAHASQGYGIGGISAMPSMHCATCYLVIKMFGRAGILKVLTWAFFIIIYISSFLLAWHYAVDGLLAVVIAQACWMLAGRILKARKAKPNPSSP